MSYKTGMVACHPRINGEEEEADPDLAETCQWFQQPALLPLTSHLTKIGAVQSGLRKFLIKEKEGNYARTLAQLTLSPEGELTGPKDYLPDNSTAALIKQGAALVEWPDYIQANTDQLAILSQASRAPRDFIYECWDYATNLISMVKIRHGTIKKYFYTWTLWRGADGTPTWYRAETPGPLPFFKPRKPQRQAIMVHEGAKAARRAQYIAQHDPYHPWHDTLRLYDHWGAMPGASDMARCHFEELHKAKPTKIVYFCDHDVQGVEAASVFSRHLKLPMHMIRLEGQEWPLSWDIAENLPPILFRGDKYIGPPLDHVMQPGTWLTQTIPQAKGRPLKVLLPRAVEEWTYVKSPAVYIHHDYPYQDYNKEQFNDAVRAFSDVPNTADLLLQKLSARADKLIYDPNYGPGRNSIGHNLIGFNTYMPTTLQPLPGDVEPWLRYLAYLFPLEKDRQHVLRWLATIILTPRHLKYNLLLISERQGTGKTTLAEIMSHLVGRYNTSWPQESDVLSAFNSWGASKRLIILSEVKNSKDTVDIYNKLFSVIDRDIEITRKFKEPYRIDSFAQVIVCSNNLRALKIDHSDRRWFIPQVNEQLRPTADWLQFYDWLHHQDGLQKIFHWFKTQNWVFIAEGELPLDTDLRQQILQETASEGRQLVMRILELLREKHSEAWLTTITLREAIILHLQKENFVEAAHTIRRTAEQMNWYGARKPIYEGHKQGYVIATHEKFLSLGLVELRNHHSQIRITLTQINSYLTETHTDNVIPLRKDLF